MNRTLPAALFFLAVAAGARADIEQTPGSQITITQCSARAPSAMLSSSDASGPPTTGYSRPSALPASNATGAASNQAATAVAPVENQSGTGSQPYILTLAFHNDAKQNATEVDVGFGPAGRPITGVKEAGSFAPGATIKREASLPNLTVSSAYDRGVCAVMRVVYADGSVWTPPTPGP